MAQESGGSSVTTGGLGLQGVFNPKDSSEYINPAADSRLNSILVKMKSPLRQGIIQQTDENVVGPQKHPYACRFMFNPNSIAVNYGGVNEAQLAPETWTAAQATAVDKTPGDTTINFRLLFDRTYEVAYGPSASVPRDLRKIGVYIDVGYLESIVGARFNFAPTPDLIQQRMQMKPCYFIFGGGLATVGLSFIGYINSLDVQYTSFSENMVPIRCEVNINATQLLGRDFKTFRAKGGTIVERGSLERRDRASAQSGRGN